MIKYNEAIKEHRLEAGMTLQYVQDHTGISNQNLSRWERGEAIPGIDFCITLAKFYGITLDELVGISEYDAADKPAIIEQSNKKLSTFDNEYAEILDDNNFIQTAKLFKAIKPELRALAFGYLVGLLQSQKIDTAAILGY